MTIAASHNPSETGPIVIMGVSGSGKSLLGQALAEALGVPFIEGDALHGEANVEKMREGIPLTDDDRWPWLSRVAAELVAQTKAHGGAVAACSSLKKTYRDHLREEVGPGLRFVFLKGSRKLLGARLSMRRQHFMPLSLLESQLETLQEPAAEEGAVTIDVDALPESILADALAALKRD